MDIRILGAHNLESANTRLISLLIDDVLAIDAGSLTSSLSFPAQERVSSILLTHRHYDHIRDVPTIALSTFFSTTIKVYSTAATLSTLSSYLLDGEIYPKFTERPSPEKPSLRLYVLEPYKPEVIDGYTVLAVPVSHNTLTVGYQVASEDGKKMFYSGDTGPGCSACWQHISPDVLIMETTMPNRLEGYARDSGHLTPRLLKSELAEFRKIKGYLPPVVLVHMSPGFEDEVKEEANFVAAELGATITLGYEGMRINI